MGNDRDTGLNPSCRFGEAIEIKVEAYRGLVPVEGVTRQDEHDLQDGCFVSKNSVPKTLLALSFILVVLV